MYRWQKIYFSPDTHSLMHLHFLPYINYGGDNPRVCSEAQNNLFKYPFIIEAYQFLTSNKIFVSIFVREYFSIVFFQRNQDNPSFLNRFLNMKIICL